MSMVVVILFGILNFSVLIFFGGKWRWKVICDSRIIIYIYIVVKVVSEVIIRKMFFGMM